MSDTNRFFQAANSILCMLISMLPHMYRARVDMAWQKSSMSNDIIIRAYGISNSFLYTHTMCQMM